MSSARIEILPAASGATQSKSGVPARVIQVVLHHLPKWRPVIMIIIFLGVLVAPFYVVTQALDNGDACSTVSATPKRDAESTVANPGRSPNSGFANYPGAASQLLARSRCVFDSNLERVGVAQSTALSNTESAINDFTASQMGKVSVFTVLFFIFAFVSFLYYWVNRKGSPHRKKACDDDLSMQGRLFIGPAAWMLLAFSLLYSQNALALLNAPSHGLVALSAAGPLSTDNLSKYTYSTAELNPFGSVMFGFDRQTEFKASALSIDAYLSGKPISENEYKNYATLYNQRVIADNKAGSMQNTAKAVQRFGTSLNTTSGILSQAVKILRSACLAIMITSFFFLVVMCSVRPVRARRYFKRWLFANVAPFGLLFLSLAALLGVNWGGIYAVSFITDPERAGVVWGWTFMAYAVQFIGYIVPWLLLYSVIRYYRSVSGWMLQSMANSDDRWVNDVGNRLVAARQQRAITGRLMLKIPYFHRMRLGALRTGGTP